MNYLKNHLIDLFPNQSHWITKIQFELVHLGLYEKKMSIESLNAIDNLSASLIISKDTNSFFFDKNHKHFRFSKISKLKWIIILDLTVNF